MASGYILGLEVESTSMSQICNAAMPVYTQKLLACMLLQYAEKIPERLWTRWRRQLRRRCLSAPLAKSVLVHTVLPALDHGRRSRPLCLRPPYVTATLVTVPTLTKPDSPTFLSAACPPAPRHCPRAPALAVHPLIDSLAAAWLVPSSGGTGAT